MPLVIAGATSGQATVQATDAQTVTITLPSTSGTLSVSSGSPTYTNLAYTGTLTGGTGVIAIGTNQIYKDASGNVGIGTSSPADRLHVYNSTNGGTSVRVDNPNGGSSASAGLLATNGTTNAQLAVAGTAYGGYGAWAASNGLCYSNNSLAIMADNGSGVIKFATGGNTERMRIDSSGNVSIGSTSANGKLLLASSSGSVGLSLQPSIGTGTYAYYSTDGTYAYIASSSGTTGLKVRVAITAPDNAMTIDSNGKFLLNTSTSPGSAMQASNYGSNYWQYGASTTGSSIFWVLNSGGTGVSLTSGNTSWAAQSDERNKDIIEPITDAANKVSTLRAVIGKYKTDEEGVRRSFLIAQDVQKVLPEVVDTDTDEQGTLSVRYSEVVPLLVAAIKELNAKVTSLEEQLLNLGVK